jgi:ferredoxin-type protein NapG
MSEEENVAKAGEPDEPKRSGVTRRDFTYGAVGVVAMLGLGGGVAIAGTPELVRPPGGQDTKRIEACVRCEKCIEVCPHKAISAARIEDGFANTRTPKMNMKNGYCDFCADFDYVPQCASVCPTGALEVASNMTGSLEKAAQTVIGKAIITRDWCLAWGLTGCRYCYDNCPHNAITLDSYSRPYVVGDACNGCGICEYVCKSMLNGSLNGTRANATDRAIVIKTVKEVESMDASDRGWA